MSHPIAAAALVALPLFAHAAPLGWTINTIDPNLPFSSMLPAAINDAGVISGEWVDTALVTHGFVLSGGQFTSFDAPLADGSAAFGVRGTQGLGMNSGGTIVGDYVAGGKAHGFVRDSAGNFSTLDLAGHTDTALFGINDSGTIAGQYDDGRQAPYGSFLRSATGVVTLVAFPSSTSTGITSLNNSGETVGGWVDAASGVHSFLRNAVGVFTTIDVPGYRLTGAWGINSVGWIVGELDDTSTSHGFVRDPAGLVTAFDVSGATSTSAFAIDTRGDIIGQYCDAGGTCHGFLATPAVPEPAHWMLLSAGFIVLGVQWRRQRRGS